LSSLVAGVAALIGLLTSNFPSISKSDIFVINGFTTLSYVFYSKKLYIVIEPLDKNSLN
jgi:hypothetical protein